MGNQPSSTALLSLSQKALCIHLAYLERRNYVHATKMANPSVPDAVRQKEIAGRYEKLIKAYLDALPTGYVARLYNSFDASAVRQRNIGKTPKDGPDLGVKFLAAAFADVNDMLSEIRTLVLRVLPHYGKDLSWLDPRAVTGEIDLSGLSFTDRLQDLISDARNEVETEESKSAEGNSKVSQVGMTPSKEVWTKGTLKKVYAARLGVTVKTLSRKYACNLRTVNDNRKNHQMRIDNLPKEAFEVLKDLI